MRITEYDIDASFPVKTAAVAADLHDREAPEVREALLSLRPDFILIPGDLTSRCYTEETHIGRKYTKPYKPPLEALDFLNFSSKLAPTYYSPGNHNGGGLRTISGSLQRQACAFWTGALCGSGTF